MQWNTEWYTPRMWKQGILRGLQSAKREQRWFAAFGTLLGVMLTVQLLLFGLLCVRTVEDMLTTRTDLRLEIEPAATNQEIQDFFVFLQQQPFIAKGTYITKEQAYERMREEDPELITFLEKFQMQNPFPDTIGVTLRSLDDYDALSTFLEQPRWRTVVDPTFLSHVTDQESQVREIMRIVQASRSLTLLVLALMGTILVLLLTELVRRRSLDRCDEVFVEQLAGAHPLSILLPFISETTLLLWLATLASAGVLLLLLWGIPLLLPGIKEGGILSLLSSHIAQDARSFLPLAFAAEFFVTPFIAAGGAWLGISTQLRSRVLSLHRS